MFKTIRWSFCLIFLLAIPQFSHAQLGGFGGVGGVGGGGAGGGNNNQNSSGVKIDPEGVLSLVVANDGEGVLDKKRREAIGKKNLSQDLNRRSPLRFVSLVTLEKQLEQLLETEALVPQELFYLAGLQRIQYVFVFPDEYDLVIAGPGEGFVPDGVGRMVGIESGRPTLRLDDLFVALRTVTRAKQLGCSIDPVPQRLAELQKFHRQAVPASQEEVEARFNQMDDILGLQDVRIDGIPTDSHFATMLVEADYRMKRIAIGLESPPVKGLKSHLSLVGSKGNFMQRWWFVPLYDSISRSDDGLAFQFTGQRAQLLTEEEIIDSSGNRSSSPTTTKSTQAFAKHFTDKFPQLADKSPVFGELQNLIDWTVFAALINKERIPEKIGWKQALLLDETRLKHPIFETPKKVPSQVNYKRASNSIIGMVCGGVVIHPQQTYEKTVATATDSKKLEGTRSNAKTAPRNDHRFWWDRP